MYDKSRGVIEVLEILKTAISILEQEVTKPKIGYKDQRTACGFCGEAIIDVAYFSQLAFGEEFCSIMCREKKERNIRFKMMERPLP